MQINPRQLDAFRNVMLGGSMTIAAELMKVSQPAVSRLIKDLEQTLGLRLFRREGNRLIPGAEAQRLFREVDRFYHGMAQIERVAQDLKSVRIGTLRIASMSALGLSVLCEGVQRFSRLRPGVMTSLDVRNSLGVLDLVAANQVDIGFVHSMGTEYPGVDIFPLQSVAAVCIMPSSHPIAAKSTIHITDLQNEKLIMLTSNNPTRLAFDAALSAAGVTYERSVETTLAHSACTMVALGLGLAVVDPFTAANFRDSKIVTRPLTPTIPFEFSMVIPSHQPRSKVLTDFIRVVKELFDAASVPT